ncbi:MAG: thiamine diphosphokinase [Treponema sp.]|nr:thiamine diphosphokinase [Treponema sp.]
MEKQLGIVFTGGEGPQPQIIRRIIDGLPVGKAVPLLVAADSGLMLAEAAGFRPDWIIGDMDSLDSESRLNSYPAESIIRHAADKDYTDTELACSLLWEKGCADVWIIGGGGGRIDHLFGIRDLFERDRFPNRWITAAEDICCIEGGKNIAMAVEQDGIVSVFPLGGGPWQAESAGLKWSLDVVRWERGLYGLSNVAVASKIEVSVRQGRFMIIRELLWQQYQ